MIGTQEIEAAAKKAAGNWQRFECFVWMRADEIPDAEQWAIIYTHNRDSGLLDQSNAAAIEKALESFTDGDDPDVVIESHGHWAVGHVDGFSVRVFRNDEITNAFQVYHELAERMDNYPILDESDYSERETEATLENIADAAYSLKHEFALPEGWVTDAFSWFWENCASAVENCDDRGGYPSEDDLRQSFEALKYEKTVK